MSFHTKPESRASISSRTHSYIFFRDFGVIVARRSGRTTGIKFQMTLMVQNKAETDNQTQTDKNGLH